MRCPVKNSEASRNPAHVMCRDHWFRVPPEIRRKIWKFYHEDPGGVEHLEAIAEAVRLVEGKIVAELMRRPRQAESR